MSSAPQPGASQTSVGLGSSMVSLTRRACCGRSSRTLLWPLGPHLGPSWPSCMAVTRWAVSLVPAGSATPVCPCTIIFIMHGAAGLGWRLSQALDGRVPKACLRPCVSIFRPIAVLDFTPNLKRGSPAGGTVRSDHGQEQSEAANIACAELSARRVTFQSHREHPVRSEAPAWSWCRPRPRPLGRPWSGTTCGAMHDHLGQRCSEWRSPAP